MAITGMVNAVIFKWLLEGGNSPLENELPLILEIAFFGIMQKIDVEEI